MKKQLISLALAVSVIAAVFSFVAISAPHALAYVECSSTTTHTSPVSSASNVNQDGIYGYDFYVQWTTDTHDFANCLVRSKVVFYATGAGHPGSRHEYVNTCRAGTDGSCVGAYGTTVGSTTIGPFGSYTQYSNWVGWDCGYRAEAHAYTDGGADRLGYPTNVC